jgi:hypothetical protein
MIRGADFRADWPTGLRPRVHHFVFEATMSASASSGHRDYSTVYEKIPKTVATAVLAAFCSPGCRNTASGNHQRLMANQIGCECRQSIILALGPAVLDPNVATLCETCFAQALVKRPQATCEQIRRFAAEKSNDWHLRLLRTRRE